MSLLRKGTSALLALLLTAGLVSASAASAQADGSSDDLICKVDPGYWDTKVIHHDEVTAEEEVEVPGQEEESYWEQRWSREVPAILEESHKERQFSRTEPAIAEESYLEYKYFKVIPGQAKESHFEYRFSRENPGHEETFTTFFKYKKVMKNSHEEYRWKEQTREVKQNSHKEYRWKKWVDGTKEVKEYRWEAVYKKRKELKGVYVTGQNDWHKGDPGTWYELPEHKQPARFDGIAPTGSVAVSVYGGPSSWGSVPYRYGESYKVYYPGPGADNWTTDGSTPAAPSGSSWGSRISRVKTPATEGHWEYYPSKDGWTTETKAAPWEQVDSRVVNDPDTYTEWENVRWTDWTSDSNPPADTDTRRYVNKQTRTVDDPDTVVLYDNGNWTDKVLGDPWVEIDRDVRSNGDFVAPFREYRAEDGTPTTDLAQAGQFKESSFEGWDQFGQPIEVVTQEYVADRTVYLTYDGENFGRTDNREEASFVPETVDVSTKWSKILGDDGEPIINKVVTQEAVPERTFYLVSINGDELVESEAVADAGWFAQTSVEGYSQFGEVKKVVTQEFIPGFTLYYVSGGEPTRELGESNWTTDKPEGWTFVDDREVVTKEAVPPTSEIITVVVKEAWDEKIRTWVPAKEHPCELPMTGPSDATPWLAASGALLVIAGAAFVVGARRRKMADLAG